MKRAAADRRFSGSAPQCKGTGAPSTVCDQSGCGLNPFRYGPGTTYDLEANNAEWCVVFGLHGVDV